MNTYQVDAVIRTRMTLEVEAETAEDAFQLVQGVRGIEGDIVGHIPVALYYDDTVEVLDIELLYEDDE